MNFTSNGVYMSVILKTATHGWIRAHKGVNIFEIKYLGIQWERIILEAHHGWLSNVTKYIRYSEMLGNTRYGCGTGNLELQQV